MKNIIHVIYPAEYLASFVIEGDHTDDDLLEMVFARWNHGSGMECEQFISSKKRDSTEQKPFQEGHRQCGHLQ